MVEVRVAMESLAVCAGTERRSWAEVLAARDLGDGVERVGVAAGVALAARGLAVEDFFELERTVGVAVGLVLAVGFGVEGSVVAMVGAEEGRGVVLVLAVLVGVGVESGAVLAVRFGVGVAPFEGVGVVASERRVLVAGLSVVFEAIGPGVVAAFSLATFFALDVADGVSAGVVLAVDFFGAGSPTMTRGVGAGVAGVSVAVWTTVGLLGAGVLSRGSSIGRRSEERVTAKRFFGGAGVAGGAAFGTRDFSHSIRLAASAAAVAELCPHTEPHWS